MHDEDDDDNHFSLSETASFFVTWTCYVNFWIFDVSTDDFKNYVYDNYHTIFQDA